MRTRLLPLGLAALFFNPVFAQSADVTRGDVYERTARATRATEPAAPLTLQAALALALSANADLSASGHELAAVEATISQAQARPNPELAALMEDTRSATRTTTLQLNQAIELGGKRAAGSMPPNAVAMPHRRNWMPSALKFVQRCWRRSSMCWLRKSVCGWPRRRLSSRDAQPRPRRGG